jgi:hypothetical protein
MELPMSLLDYLKGKKRRIMRTFKLSEISAVDHPAQEDARATMIKRASYADLFKDIDLSDGALGIAKAKPRLATAEEDPAEQHFENMLSHRFPRRWARPGHAKTRNRLR